MCLYGEEYKLILCVAFQRDRYLSTRLGTKKNVGGSIKSRSFRKYRCFGRKADRVGLKFELRASVLRPVLALDNGEVGWPSVFSITCKKVVNVMKNIEARALVMRLGLDHFFEKKIWFRSWVSRRSSSCAKGNSFSEGPSGEQHDIQLLSGVILEITKVIQKRKSTIRLPRLRRTHGRQMSYFAAA